MLSVGKTSVTCTDLAVIGSVEDVIAGVINEKIENRHFSALDYRFGFEVASPHSQESIGETVLVNQNCYTTSTDKHDHYLQTIYGNQLKKK